MKKLGLSVILFVLMTTGCGPVLKSTKFDERYMPNAQPGKPLLSLDIPQEMVEKHMRSYRTLLWEGGNTFFLLYLQDPVSTHDKVLDTLNAALSGGVSDDATTVEPQINEAYVVDIAKKEFTMLPETEKADIAARMKERYKYYPSAPEGAFGKAVNFLSAMQGGGSKYYEGDIKQDDVAIHLKFEIKRTRDRNFQGVTISNNLFDKTEKWFMEERNSAWLNCQINSFTIRNVQLSPDGQKYYLCGLDMFDITKRDKKEAGMTRLMTFQEMAAGSYKDRIKGSSALLYGNELYDKLFLLAVRFNKDWSKVALWNGFANDVKCTEKIEIYPSKY